MRLPIAIRVFQQSQVRASFYRQAFIAILEIPAQPGVGYAKVPVAGSLYMYSCILVNTLCYTPYILQKSVSGHFGLEGSSFVESQNGKFVYEDTSASDGRTYCFLRSTLCLKPAMSPPSIEFDSEFWSIRQTTKPLRDPSATNAKRYPNTIPSRLGFNVELNADARDELPEYSPS